MKIHVRDDLCRTRAKTRFAENQRSARAAYLGETAMLPASISARRWVLVLAGLLGVASQARAGIATYSASLSSSISVNSIPAGFLAEAPTTPFLPANTPFAIDYSGGAVATIIQSVNPTSINPGTSIALPIKTTLTAGTIAGSASGADFSLGVPAIATATDTSGGNSYGLAFKNLNGANSVLTVNYAFDSVIDATAQRVAKARASSVVSLAEFDLGNGQILQQIPLVNDGVAVSNVSFNNQINSLTKESVSSGSVVYTISPSQQVGFRLQGQVTGFASVPEPSPLVLGCIGMLACFAHVRWSKLVKASTASNQ